MIYQIASKNTGAVLGSREAESPEQALELWNQDHPATESREIVELVAKLEVQEQADDTSAVEP